VGGLTTAVVNKELFTIRTKGVSFRAGTRGAVSLKNGSKFVAGLLEGREPQLGLYVAPLNMEAATTASEPVVCDFAAGELTIGWVRVSAS
jgi:hypothetical protein